MDLSYILNELGEERENYFNAVSPPIIQTSNFTFKTVSDFRQALSNEYDTLIYSRGHNPTLNILRKKLAALDGAEDALVFSSGIAAISVPVLSLLQQGDHAVKVTRANLRLPTCTTHTPASTFNALSLITAPSIRTAALLNHAQCFGG